MADSARLVLEVDSNGVVEAADNLREFSSRAEDAARASGQLEDAQRGFLGSLSDAGAAMESGSESLGALNLNSLAAEAGIQGLVGALEKVAHAAVGFASDSIQSFSNFEQIENSLSGVLRSASKGKELFEDLRSFSMETTFGVDTLANASQQLLSTGTASDQLKTKLKQLGDIAGGDTNKFNDLVSIFSKIQNTGKASSMQLQQLALRGVPIYQMLQEMGVEGNATADQIEEAFKRMTDAGGQFHDNMESINATIQGKEGFVSDTFKEFLTSFAEASGLADAYKAALDVIFNALQGIVDWLQKINDNPVSQAIFRGVIVGAIAAIGAVIVTTLIPALISTIAQLTIIQTLKTAFSGPVGWISAGVGLLVAGVTALASALSNVEKQAVITGNTLENSFAIGDNALNGLVDDISDIETEYDTIIERGKELAEGIYYYDNTQLDMFRTNLHEYKAAMEDILREAETNTANDWTTSYEALNGKTYNLYEDQLQKLQRLEKAYDDMLGKANNLYGVIGSQNIALERQNQLIQMAEKFNNDNVITAESLADAYASTAEAQLISLDAEIKRYETLIKLGGQYVAVSGNNQAVKTKDGRTGYLASDAMGSSFVESTNEELRQAKAVLQEYYSKRNKKSGGGSGSKNISWRDVLGDVTGIDVDDYEKNSKSFIESMKKGLADLFGANVGRNKSGEVNALGASVIQEFANNLKKAQTEAEKLEKILAGVRDDVNEIGENDPDKAFEMRFLTGWQESKDNVTDAEKSLENLRERYKEIYEARQKLFELNSTITDGTQFKENENTIMYMDLGLDNLAKDIANQVQVVADAKFEEAKAALEYEKDLVSLTTEEQLIRENILAGYSEQQAKALAVRRIEADNEKAFYDEYSSLEKREELIGLSGKALQKQLYIQQGMNEGQAAYLVQLNEEISLREKIANAKTLAEKGQWRVDVASQKYQETGKLDAGMYAAGTAMTAVGSATQGTDVGNALDGLSKGGVWGAVIEVVIGAIVKVAKSFGNFDKVMSPVTEWLQKLAPLLQFVFDTLEIVIDLVSALLDFLRPFMTLIQLLGTFLKNTVGVLMGWLADAANAWAKMILGDLYDSTNELEEEQKKEADRLKELNKQYQTLSAAIDEQNQYYLRQKMAVNAQAYNGALGAMSVNDLIITKNGTFSTHPDDTIFAMKHPEDLAGGGAVNVKVYNERGGDTDVAVSKNSDNELVIRISRKVADDYARGANGWNDAVAYRESRTRGRRVMS